jgi:hypothetical protein
LAAQSPDDVAVAVEVHAGRCSEWRGFAEIDERPAPIGELDGHEAAAADVAGRREDHAQCVADGNRGVDGVAALLQDIDADLGRKMLARDDHAVARSDGRRRCRVRMVAPNADGERKQYYAQRAATEHSGVGEFVVPATLPADGWHRKRSHGATVTPSMPCRARACATNPEVFIVTEIGQVSGAGFRDPRRSHRLVDHHEPAFEQTQAGKALRIGFERLLHACGDVELSRQEKIGDLGR